MRYVRTLLLILSAVAISATIVSAETWPVLSWRQPQAKLDLKPDFMEKLFGPTDVNAALGNGRMAAGVNEAGTVSVIKWPRPSYHDQVRYLTISRKLPRLGARENDGVFFGILFAEEPYCLWLRDADYIEQRYFTDTNILITSYIFVNEGLKIVVFDFVDADNDALVRQVTVNKTINDAITPTGLVAFANLALCQRKIPYAPVADWLFDSWASDSLVYDAESDLLIQDSAERGLQADPVAAAMGFWEPSSGHQCGHDGGLGAQSAYADAQDGVLSGSDTADGQVDAALVTPLQFDDRQLTQATFFVVFAEQADAARKQAQSLRSVDATSLLMETVTRHREWLGQACLPDTDDEDVLAVVKRALLLNAVVRDESSGALGCSVATQPPYALDWSRDGTYMNVMLDMAGYTDWVGVHNLFYAQTQRQPLGNWDMCVYGDGTPGGPLFLELDTMGLTAWTLWDHYRYLTGDDAALYLDEVYPAIQRTADFFVWWRDPRTGLPLPAFESDFPMPASTLLSASMAWLALRVAQSAGEIQGEVSAKLQAWSDRQMELNEAIYEYYFDSQQQVFLADAYTLAYMIYPVEFLPADDQRMQNTAEAIYQWLLPILHGETDGGSYLGLITIALARAWEGDAEKMARLDEAMDFLVHAIPTPGTHHYGECFVNLGDRFETRTGIPHPMTAALTYITAAEMYGIKCPDDDSTDDDDAADDDDTTDDGDTTTDDDDVENDDDDGCGC